MHKHQKIKDHKALKEVLAKYRDAEVARLYDVSRERIRQLRQRYKIAKPDRSVYKMWALLDARKLYKKKLSVKTISKTISVSESTIYKWHKKGLLK
jgi:transposase